MTGNSHIGVFGEVLFDVFPDKGRVLGGAPFNVAWHLHALGCAPRLVSRVGRDSHGDAIRSAMADWGMDTTGIQSDPVLPTGQVIVRLEDCQPTYEILADQAYDAIDASEIDASDYSLLYHGTLALRSAQSRRAVERLKLASDCTVFMDVNLRDPWWERDQVLALADEAHWIKLNDEELTRLAPSGSDLESAARSIKEAHKLSGVVVTRGKDGAFAIADQGQFAEIGPAESIDIADTVGAGDAFAAIVIVGITREWPLDVILQRARQFASHVVAQRGAIVKDRTIYNAMLDEWSHTR